MAAMRHALQRSRKLLADQLLQQRGFAITSRGYFASSTAGVIPAQHASFSGLISLRAFASSAEAGVTAGPKRTPVSYVSLGITLLTGAGVIWYYNQLKEQKMKKALQVDAKVVGKAAVGGPFDLVDHNGKPFTDKDLHGDWSLLYFGFTYCPDICPDELGKLAEAIKLIEERSKVQVRPVFISVDPERDSVAQIKEYVKEFHPRLIGLTGTPEKVKQAAKAYRVYYSKSDDTDDYLVDHSIITYLINPEGNFVTFFGKNFSADQIADSVHGHVNEWKGGKSAAAEQQ